MNTSAYPNSTQASMSGSRSWQSLRSERPDGGGLNPWDDFLTYAREYIREEPEVAACVCLGIGFILGWKLKPW